jgi:hypothetical protein
MRDRHSILPSFHTKSLSPEEISGDLLATLGADAMTYWTVAREVDDRKCTHPKVISPPGSGFVVYAPIVNRRVSVIFGRECD